MLTMTGYCDWKSVGPGNGRGRDASFQAMDCSSANEKPKPGGEEEVETGGSAELPLTWLLSGQSTHFQAIV